MNLSIFLTVALAYVFCHGVTAMLVTPVQRMILPEETAFASLIYLPHGVRVLATWAYGWRAILALAAGAAIAAWLFTPAQEIDLLETVLIPSILAGACSAFLAFELVRFAGFTYYFGCTRKLDWRGMIVIGALSSIINSVIQTMIFSGLIGWDQLAEVLLIYATGDLVGLVACMAALMFIFRWSRLFKTAKR